MRAAILLILSTLLLGALAAPARAGPPLSLRAMLGMGTGSGETDDERADGGRAALADADLAWSFSRSRSVLLTAEAAGVDFGRRLDDLSERHLDGVGHYSFLLGLEQSAPRPGFHPFLQAGVGVGRVSANERWSTGVAVGGAIGVRLLSAHGEIGFTFGLRTGEVIASDARSSATGIAFGLHLHPRAVPSAPERSR